jgi:hypothetical protein
LLNSPSLLVGERTKVHFTSQKVLLGKAITYLVTASAKVQNFVRE